MVPASPRKSPTFGPRLLYGVLLELAVRVVYTALDEEKLRVLAAIVTFPAALAKREAESASAQDPGTTGGIGPVRYRSNGPSINATNRARTWIRLAWPWGQPFIGRVSTMSDSERPAPQ
jgi:hypothetical protein